MPSQKMLYSDIQLEEKIMHLAWHFFANCSVHGAINKIWVNNKIIANDIKNRITAIEHLLHQ